MHASRTYSTMIIFSSGSHNELVMLFIIISQQVLPTTHVTEKIHDVTVAYRPEIRAGPIIADLGEAVALHKLMQVFPIHQVFRAE